MRCPLPPLLPRPPPLAHHSNSHALQIGGLPIPADMVAWTNLGALLLYVGCYQVPAPAAAAAAAVLLLTLCPPPEGGACFRAPRAARCRLPVLQVLHAAMPCHNRSEAQPMGRCCRCLLTD